MQQLQTRKTLKTLHLQLLTNSHEIITNSKPLDSSIKRNSAFVKKLKTCSPENIQTLITELQSLNVSKYLQEIISSIADIPKLKNSLHVVSVAEIVSILHIRFPDFSNELMLLLFKQMSSIDPQVTIEKKSTIIKLISELYLTGITHPKYAQSTITHLIKDLLNTDKEHLKAPILISLIKNYQEFFISKTLDYSWMIQSEQEKLYNMVSIYFKSISARLIKEHNKLLSIENSNQESSIARGTLSDERKEKYDSASKLVEYLKSTALSLATYLDFQMPVLEKIQELTYKTTISIVDSSIKVNEDGLDQIWDDDETRDFYENIQDLKNLVPAICLAPTEISIKEELLKLDYTQSDSSITDSSLVDYNATTKPDDNDAIIPTEEDIPVSSLSKYEALQTKLCGTLNKEQVDQIAVDFAFVNSKGTKKRLIKLIIAQMKSRVDLIPYFARLIATLNPYIPEVGLSVIQTVNIELESGFHGFQRHKSHSPIDQRMQNVRFIGELTKFKIVPIHITFHYLKTLLDDFSATSIDLLCAFLENCGRFLFININTKSKMASYLETLQRKKNALNLDSRSLFMIDNAYYHCIPPEKRAVLVEIEKPTWELFIRKLLFVSLSKSSVDKTIIILRKLNWQDKTVFDTIREIFRNIHHFKFSQIDLVACIASELSKFHPDFGKNLLDDLLGMITVGLQKNLFKENQQRLAQVKYLGELYISKMIDHGMIFDVLYLILTYGVENGIPLPGVPSELDAPNDFFRARMCCTILDTCGRFFSKRKLSKKLNRFLCFFQLYISTKIKPPMDVDFFIMDTIDLIRPSWKFVTSYPEAVRLVNEIIEKEMVKSQTNLIKPDEEAEESDEEVEDNLDNSNGIVTDFEKIESNDIEQTVEEPIESEDSDSEYEFIDDANEDQQDFLEFDSEFSKMMNDSESRKPERKPQHLDISIPVINRSNQEAIAPEEDKVMFTLLTKKGSKQQSKSIAMPSDSILAVNTLSKQAANAKEKQELKKIVLNYGQRDFEFESSPKIENLRKINQYRLRD